MATNNVINLIGATPLFLYKSTDDQLNVTGDNTEYSVIFATKIYDTTNSFDGTSTFTAPISGTYLFNIGLYYYQITGAGTVRCTVLSNGVTYFVLLSTAAQSQYQFSSSVPIYISAGNTAKVIANVTGLGRTVDLLGSTSSGGIIGTYFGGTLINAI